MEENQWAGAELWGYGARRRGLGKVKMVGERGDAAAQARNRGERRVRASVTRGTWRDCGGRYIYCRAQQRQWRAVLQNSAFPEKNVSHRFGSILKNSKKFIENQENLTEM
jgi:hypothetical protein